MKRRSGFRWAWVSVLFAAVMGAAGAVAGAVALAAPSSQPVRPAFGVARSARLGAPRVVNVRALLGTRSGSFVAPHTQPPSPALLLSRAGVTPSSQRGPLQGYRVATQAPRRGSKLRSASRPRSGARGAPSDHPGGLKSVPGSAAEGTSFENLTSFTGATSNTTGCCEPPDTQVAVGPNDVFEAVNLNAFAYDRGGNQLGTFSLVNFFDVGQAGSDPKIVYDAGTGRWFMTMMDCVGGQCGGNWTSLGVDLAVSQTSDPLGSWWIYGSIFNSDQGNLQDQPKLGFSDDKVTVSDNVYSGHCGAGSCFLHEAVDVLQKSDLLNGQSAGFVEDTSTFAFNTIPAIPTPTAAGSDSTQYTAWQGFGSLGTDQITGTPDAGNVSFANQQSPPIGGMTGTVDAPGIPSGAASGNEVESVAWQDNQLWAVSTDGCTPAGDSGTRDCTRIDQVDTSTPSSLTVTTDLNLSDGPGSYEVYPSVTTDFFDNMMLGFTSSHDSSTQPSAEAVGHQPGGGYTAINYLFSNTTYCGTRWGDYSGIGQDPADEGNVWTAQEYGAVDSCSNWATGIGGFSFDGPTIDAASPSSGPATGGTTVDIFGYDFVNGGTSVSFGGTPAAGVTFITPQHIQALSPSGSGGPVDITVTTSNGTSATTSGDHFSWVPAVTGLNPTAGPTAGGTVVQIVGAGFNGASSVDFGGTPASFTVDSDNYITATAPAGSPGTVDVTVTGPTGTSAASFADAYTYDAPPTLTGVSPNAGPASGGNTVIVKGTNFVPVSTVRFGTTVSPLVTFVSSTRLKAIAPAHPAGVVNVSVTTPGGTTPTVGVDHYTFAPRPTVGSVVPNAGSTAGGTTVTINGTNFVSGATVKFGTTASTVVTFVSSTKLTAKAPTHAAGTVAVSVTTTGGTSAPVNGDLYAYGPPAVTSVVPNAGPAAGANTVTINGQGLVPGTTVRFATAAATAVTFVSPSKLTARAPAHPAGVVNVSVTTPAGTSAAVTGDRYTYESRPAVSSLSPDAGAATGGNIVTINGTSFAAGATVKFGTAASTVVTFVSSTKLTAKAPAHAAATVNVTVTTPGGTSAAVNGDLYAYGPPAVSSFTPSSGITGSSVTINGTNFVPGATVKFGTRPSSTVTFVSPTRVTAVVPNAATAGRIAVTTAAGTGTSAATFTPTFSLTSFSPASGPTGTVVTIHGAGFNSSSTVRFNGHAASTTHVSATQLKATVPSTATTGPITVTNTAAPTGTISSATNYTKT